jgi:hypothetical protein
MLRQHVKTFLRSIAGDKRGVFKSVGQVMKNGRLAPVLYGERIYAVRVFSGICDHNRADGRVFSRQDEIVVESLGYSVAVYADEIGAAVLDGLDGV